MVTVDNFAYKLNTLILLRNPSENATEWRLLGQEHDDSLLFSWVQSSKTQVGIYSVSKNTLNVLYTFEKQVNCIQASINGNRTYLSLVIKEITTDENTEQNFIYKPFIYKINSNEELYDLKLERSKQVMVQFLYHKQSVLSENQPVKFLILIHQECILQYQIKNDSITLNNDSFTYESLVRTFIWAQWDPIHQTLYYIHFKKPIRGLVEDEERAPVDLGTKVSPTLSGLQFHDDLPHESVLNIPLNLPHLSSVSNSHRIYEDDTVPLRIHDCSLELVVLTNSSGIVCICHNYLYQPILPQKELKEEDEAPVHMAYSVTVLHQSCVMHCVIPEIPWNKAKTIRPLFKLHGNHLLVFIAGMCTQLLDIGVMHEPCCHITIKPIITKDENYDLMLTPLVTLGDEYVVNLATLDLYDITIPTKIFVDTFKSDTLLENKLSIMHYLILHRSDIETAADLITWQVKKPFTIGLPQILREFLIGTSYASVLRNLPSDANDLINLLPITIQRIGNDMEVKLQDNHIACLSQDMLWNASMMLLSPQQRIVPYRSDIWVKLWEQLAKISKGKIRFKHSHVVDKLIISLVCYQPEVLSRSSTPMSPGSVSSTGLNEFLSNQFGKGRNQADALPFYEVDNCTASKQEHIISVNLRELSMHLLKQSAENKITRFQWQLQTPMHVHAVATRYVTAQLDQSRYLCQILCKAATYEPRHDLDKGFVYINDLSEERRYILFTILERYYLAVESIAFPLPQGFTSFFTFLGYKTLSFDMFLQYVTRNVFELQVDVMKIIMTDLDNSKINTDRRFKLLSLLPRSRAKRLLNQWNHPLSLMLRAREHSLNILSGVAGPAGRAHGNQKSKGFRGISAPSFNNSSPLDTFLDLLTAKASLTDLDFNLIIEATETLAEDVLL
ncbi:unnamed protein product [Brassicogethes aeneus]|uniref:Gamma-secretase-activating protein C-terminal domain-containing protein n=1 Tax=Brassicogethes aeneus TaxID=1431903 RepID=A0A9P0BF78_BRAAE|nr:unnamed protein product [Brassicogethes aeneus]